MHSKDPWHFAALGKVGQEAVLDEPVTRTWHWLVSGHGTGGCVLAQPEAVLEQRLLQVRMGCGCGL